jgi:signal transduction histidine kinase
MEPDVVGPDVVAPDVVGPEVAGSKVVAPDVAPPTPPARVVRAQLSATERLVQVAQELSHARELREIMAVVRDAARELTGADGATFVLRDGDQCFYAEENAIRPLWKGRRFPLANCISGWTMLHGEAAVIEDIYADPRIPQDAYRPTFVKSLAMVPIRSSAPVGAIGNYWAEQHRASEGEVKLLKALADLTSLAMENVQLYGQLQQRVREAGDAVRAREEFISIAAHELRTPLTALLLQLQRLEGLSRSRPAANQDPRVPESAARAVASAQRLAALVDSLLDASQLTEESLQLKAEELDLVQVAREVLERLTLVAQRAGCELLLLGACSVPGRWDRLRVEQLLTHLLSNAFAYGRGKPVRVTLERVGEAAHVEVSDQGPGIAPELAGKIFERFGRIGPIAQSGGLGLGLYLARKIVEAHGGGIRFESKPERGCTFVFELPLQSPPR